MASRIAQKRGLRQSARKWSRLGILAGLAVFAGGRADAQTTNNLSASLTSTPVTNSATLATGSGLTINLGLGVEYLIVGGGGGGGGQLGGGGGAGAFLSNVGGAGVTMAGTNFAVSVGSGGSGGLGTTRGSSGGNSSIFGLTAIGGGGGGSYNGNAVGRQNTGLIGGSGGGSAPDNNANTVVAGAAGTAGQGNNGGGGGHNPFDMNNTLMGGGGGGAGSAGTDGYNLVAGGGGVGRSSAITGTSQTYAGGGGGGVPGNSIWAAGGSGVGGNGATLTGNGANSVASTGSGGGGGGNSVASSGGNGSAGVVVVRYQNATDISSGGNTSGTYTNGGNIWHFERFTTNGTLALSYSPTDLTAVQSGVISGSGGLTYNSAGTLILRATNTYTGGTLISAGTLELGGRGASPLGSGNVTNNATLSLNPSNMLTVSNNISGTGALVKSGAPQATLAGSNSFTGLVTIQNGSLQLDNANAIVNGAGVDFGSSNTPSLHLNGVVASVNGGLNGGTNARLQSINNTTNATLIVNVASNSTASFAGQLSELTSGALSFRKNGAGTQILSGSNNTYTGGTTISAGTLQIGDGGATGSIGSGNVTNQGILAWNKSANETYSLRISGNGSFEKSGAGMLTLVSTNSHAYTGDTVIRDGNLKFSTLTNVNTTGGANYLPPQGRIIVQTNGTLSFGGNMYYNLLGGQQGFTQPFTPVTVEGGTIDSSGTVTTFSNLVMNGGTLRGTGGFLPAWGAFVLYGTLNVQADSAFVLASGSDNSITAGAWVTNPILAIRVTNGATLTNGLPIQDYNNSANKYSITKTGAGTLILNATNTYTGATAVNEGILRVGATGRINASAVTVNSGGTIEGSGTINSLSIASGGVLKVLVASTNSAGAWNTGGAITFASGATVNANAGSLAADKTYYLVRGTSITGTPTVLNSTSFTVSTAGGNLTLTPKDTDGDGLSDFTENQLGTNPSLTDTDGDGLADKQETDLGTNPISVDSDGDGLNDNVETGTGTFAAGPGGNQLPVTFTIVTNKITDASDGGTLTSTNSGSMSGKIMNGTVEVGDWFLSDFRYTRKAIGTAMTLTAANFATNGTAAGNPYGRAGVGMDMNNLGMETTGVMKFSYQVRVAMKPGYRADKIFLLGKNPAVAGRSYGPQSNNTVGPNTAVGMIQASGFAGTGTVLNPSNNLATSNGTTFPSGQLLPAYYNFPPTGQDSGSGDYANSVTAWALQVPAANPVSFVVDFSAGTKSAASEASAFSVQVFREDTGTNPLLADSDGDGLSDAVETNTGVYVSATNAGTDPFKADTDGDGISDGVEVSTLNSNPNVSQTPGALIAQHSGASSFVATWGAVSGAAGYEVQVSTEPSFTSGLIGADRIVSPGTTTSLAVTGLSGQIRYYRVRSVLPSAGGPVKGAWSPAVSAPNMTGFGKFVSLNATGNGDNFQSASSASPTSNSYTITFWMRPDRLGGVSGTENVQVVRQGINSSNGWANVDLDLLPDGSLSFGQKDGTQQKSVASGPSSILINNWYHVALVRDATNSTLRLYLNGSGVATNTNAFGLTNWTINNSMGFAANQDALNDDGNLNRFKGALDDVRVYRTVRTPAQILQDMSGPLSKTEANNDASLFFYAPLEGTSLGSTDANSFFKGTLNGSGTGTITSQSVLTAPVLAWTPSPINLVAPAILSTNELTATATAPTGGPVSGAWSYLPAAGTSLSVGTNEVVGTFVPADLATYAITTITNRVVVSQPDAGRLLVWGAGSFTTNALMASGVTQAVIASASVDTNVIAVLKNGGVTTWSLTGDPVSALDAPEFTQADVVMIAAGEEHFLALKNNGQLVAWGRGLSDTGTEPEYGQSLVPSDASTGVVAVAAGDYHSLALRGDGRVVAWGWDNYEQSQVPAAASNGVVAIAAGRYTSFALKFDGTLVSWGRGEYGAALPAVATNGVVAISAGRQHAMALKSDGTVKAWGTDAVGQLTTATGSPAGLSGVKAVTAGRYYSMALKSDRTVEAWGETGYTDDPFLPPADLANVVSIFGGRNHGLAIVSAGQAPRLALNGSSIRMSPGASTNLTVQGVGVDAAFGSVGLPAGVTLTPSGILTVGSSVPTTNTMVRLMAANENGEDARVVRLEISSGTSSAPIFSANFNDFTGSPTANQYQTGLPLVAFADVPGWEKMGINSVHLVNRGAVAPDWAVMIFQDNLILSPDIDANEKDVQYRVSLDLGPAVYENPSQATRTNDAVIVDVVDTDTNDNLEVFQQEPGAWQNPPVLTTRTFTYTGTGSGAVRLVISSANSSEEFFAGTVDNITITLATAGKTTPTLAAAPTASAITYGSSLGSATLTGGTASVAGTFAFKNPAATPGAGIAQNFPVVFTPTDTANYNPVEINVAVTVNKKELTVTAENKARNVGEDNPVFTVTITGFVLGEDKSVLSSQPTAYSEANVDSPAGAYDILVEGGASANYTFNRVKGTLTVNHPDTDGDGLSDAAELALGTNPNHPNTDGDAYNDGADPYPLTANHGFDVTFGLLEICRQDSASGPVPAYPPGVTTGTVMEKVIGAEAPVGMGVLKVVMEEGSDVVNLVRTNAAAPGRVEFGPDGDFSPVVVDMSDNNWEKNVLKHGTYRFSARNAGNEELISKDVPWNHAAGSIKDYPDFAPTLSGTNWVNGDLCFPHATNGILIWANNWTNHLEYGLVRVEIERREASPASWKFQTNLPITGSSIPTQLDLGALGVLQTNTHYTGKLVFAIHKDGAIRGKETRFHLVTGPKAPPVAPSLSSLVASNGANKVGPVLSTDPAGETVTLSLPAGSYDNDLFQITPAKELQLKSGVFARAAKPSYQLLVRAANETGLFAESLLTLSVPKLAPSVSVSVGSYTYNGSFQGPGVEQVSKGGSTGAVTLQYGGNAFGGAVYGPTDTPPTDAGNYTVVANVAEDANYNQASSSPTAFTLAKANYAIGGVTATAIQFGQALAQSSITGTATTGGGVIVPGLFAFESSDLKPNAGLAQVFEFIFTPTDIHNYVTGSGTVDVNVTASPLPSVTFAAPASLTYDGTGKIHTATASGVSGFSYEYRGRNSTIYAATDEAPVNAGDYTVKATSTDPNYSGSAEQDFTITKAPVTLTLGGLNQTYNGSPKLVTVTPNPVGVSFAVQYDGGSTPPRNAGNYPVLVTVTDQNYTGSKSDTLVVAKADPVINTPPTISAITYGQALSAATITDGVFVPTGTFAFVNPGATPGAGVAQEFEVRFTPADTANYNPGTQLMAVTVNAAPLTITGISVADKEFDGTKAATITGTASYVGLVNGETFAVTGTPTAVFLTPDVGNGKAVEVNGYTAPSANYTVTQPSGLTAKITAAVPRTEIRLAALSTGYIVSARRSNAGEIDWSSTTGSMAVGSQRSANGSADADNQRAGAGFATFRLTSLFLTALSKPGAKFYVELKVDGIGAGTGGVPYTDGLDLRYYGVRDNALLPIDYYNAAGTGGDQPDIVATTASTGVKKVELTQASAISQIPTGAVGQHVGFGFLNSAGVNTSVPVGNSFAETYSFNVSAVPSDFALVVSLPDNDEDGLADAFETNTGTFASATDTGSDPAKADTDGDGVTDGAEVAAGTNPLIKNILRFRPIDMLALGKGNFSIPESNLAEGSVTPAGFRYSSSTNAAYYGGVPFFVTDKANQVWHAAKAPGGNGTGVVSETFPIAVNNVYGFYTMAGLWWGAAGSYVTYTFNFSDGSFYSKSLTNNVDLRDFNIPSVWANSINGTTTQNVFAVGTYYLDRQWIDLAAAGHGGKNLVSFTITDSGADAAQDMSRGSRIFLAAATAQVGAPGQIPPGATDTDNDGILDSFELGLPNSTKPDDADTDDDGLSDGTEISGVTDPLVADTDSDGANDGAEAALGTDPLLDSSNPRPIISTSPAAATKVYGENHSLSVVVATNYGPFGYQWRKGGTNLSGATGSSLAFSPLLRSDAGSYDVVVTNTYGAVTSAVATLTVNKATPGISVNPDASTITYGQTLSASTLTGGSATVSGKFAFTSLSTQPAAGGADQSVTFTPDDIDNYQAVTTTVFVAVNKAIPTISESPAATAITYGQTLASSVLSGGAANTPGSFAFTTPSKVPPAGTASESVTFTPEDLDNYNSATANILVTVDPALATVTMGNLNQTFDGAAKAVTVSTLPSALSTSVRYNGSVDAPTNAGTYTVVANVTDANHVGSATNTLTINKASPVITWNAPVAITYGTKLSATQLNATSTVMGTFVYDPDAGAQLNAGTNTLKVVLTPTDTVNYDPATNTVSLVINKASPVISWNAPAAITYGTALSATQLNATSTVTGTFAYDPDTGAQLNAGTNTLKVVLTPTDAVNYDPATNNVNLVVNQATLTVTAVSTNRPYGLPNPALNLTYSGFQGSDNVAVLDVAPAVTTSAGLTSVFGSYPITVSGGSDNNYFFSYVAGTLTVTDGDLDGDGLADSAELAAGTNPSQADSDGDGLSDKVETNTGAYVSAADTGTDPLKSDTDGDGVNDGTEVTAGTSPLFKPFFPADTFAVTFNGTSTQREILPNPVKDNFTFSFWIKTTATGVGSTWWFEGLGLLDGEVGGVTDDFGTALMAGGKIGFGVGNPDVTLISDGSVNNGEWHHVAVTRDSASGRMTVYIDGLLDKSGTGPAGTKAASGRLTLGSLQTNLRYFSGEMADFRIYDRVINAADVWLLANRLAVSGSAAVATLLIDADADGLDDAIDPDPTKADTDGDGLTDGQEVNTYGTSPSLADTDSDGAPDGVEVTAGTDPKLASSVPKPSITSQPIAITRTVGDNASFSVTAVNPSGVTAGPNYQWKKNGENIPGETSSTLTLSLLGIDSEGGYSVAVSNAYGSVASTEVQLIVNKATPVIETVPVPGAITYGDKLSAATLVGGLAKVGAAEVEGFFSYESGDLKPGAGKADRNVTFIPLDPDSYNPVSVTVSVTVNKKALTVQANNQIRLYGQANPTFTLMYTGLVAGESSITPAPSVTTSANAGSLPGSYAIEVTGPAQTNYDVNFVNGTLTVRDGDQDGDGVGDSAELAAGTDPADPGDRPAQLSAGWNHSLYIPVIGGHALAWGVNVDGRCGLNKTNSPIVSGEKVLDSSGVVLSNLVSVAAGGAHSLALQNAGGVRTVFAAGANSRGQIGQPLATTQSGVFRPVSGAPANVVALAAGGRHSLALAKEGTNGRVWVWGDNNVGQLGLGAVSQTSAPTRINSLPNIVALAAGAEHSLALAENGDVYAWGRGNSGQLGYYTLGGTNLPRLLTNGIAQIAAGDKHTLLLGKDGKIYACGLNSSGQLGLGTNVALVRTPTEVTLPAGVSVRRLVVGLDRAHAIATDGRVFAWGYNRYGELGLPATAAEPYAVFTPTEVPALQGAREIASGSYQTFTIDSSGGLLASGFNEGGQLGVGSTNNVTTAPAPTTEAGKLNQTIAFTVPSGPFTTATSIMLTASADSGLNPVYSSSAPMVAVVEGSRLRFLTPGTVRITASQPGSETFNAAVPVTQELTVVRDATLPVITLAGAVSLDLYVGDTYTEPGFSALDPVDGDLSADVYISGVVNTAVAGSYTLTYRVEDAAGNLAQAVRTVMVNEPPSLTLRLAASPMVMTNQATDSNVAAVDAGLQILGRPSINLTAATVKIVSGRQTGDTLALSGYSGPISATYNSNSGTLRLTGTANLAGYQEALRKVTLATTNRTVTNRTVTMALGSGVAFTNGHIYEYVSTLADWETARAAAKTRQVHGEFGYLANSTSAAENDFLLGLLQEAGKDAWLGGSDTQGVGYKWFDGPEAGQLFWNGVGSGGSAVGGQYSNWGAGEPNDFGWSTGFLSTTYESYAMMTHGTSYVIGGFTRSTAPGKWNDAPSRTSSSATYRLGYLVEYGSSATNGVLFAGTRTVEMIKGTPVITGLPAASAITAGQALNASTLTGGVANVAGTFTWTMGSTVPPVGTNTYSVTFTPDESASYESVVTSVSVVVNKATPTMAAAPTASPITAGQALSASTLSGGSASVPGTFAWASPSTVPSSSGAYTVIFTPADSLNFSSTTLDVTVTVNSASAGPLFASIYKDTYQFTPSVPSLTITGSNLDQATKMFKMVHATPLMGEFILPITSVNLYQVTLSLPTSMPSGTYYVYYDHNGADQKTLGYLATSTFGGGTGGGTGGGGGMGPTSVPDAVAASQPGLTLSSGSGAITTLSVEASPAPTAMLFSYNRPAGGSRLGGRYVAEGLEYEVQRSTSLGSWMAVEAEEVNAVPLEAGWERVTVRVPSTGNKAFLRLKISDSAAR